MSNAPSNPRRVELWSKVLVIALVGIFLLALAGFAIAVIDAPDEDAALPARPSLPAAIPPDSDTPADAPEAEAAAQPRILLALAETEPELTPSASASPAPEALASPGADASPSATPVLTATTMPVAPVAGFWSKREGVKRRDIVRALKTGEIVGFKRVVVEADHAQIRFECGERIVGDLRFGG